MIFKLKGYWHFAALAAGAAIITVYFNNNWLILAFMLWLFYLYFFDRLGKWQIIISLTIFIFYSLYIPSVHDMSPIELSTETSQYSGTIAGPVKVGDGRVEFTLQENNYNTKLLILYFSNNDNQLVTEHPQISRLNYGATCTIKGIAEYPDESRNPGQFDYRQYLLSKGVTHQVKLDSLEDIQCEGSTFLQRFYTLRERLLGHINDKLSSFTASWLGAIVFGDDSNIDPETEEIFQRWSLSHIIAISGSNIGLIVVLFYFLFIKLNLLTKEKAGWLLVFLLPVYALLAGGEPSVWRAAIMVVIFIMLNKFKLKFSYTDVLSIVFILLILVDKYIVYHVGFQLSFIVTFAILLSTRWISETESLFWQVLQISFVSQMVIIPIQFAYFFIFQPLSILVNLLVIPYFSLFAIPLMYILLPITFLPDFLVNLFDKLFVFIHSSVLFIVEFIDNNLFFPFLMGGFSLLVAIIYFLLFFIFMNDLQQKRLSRSFQTGLLICFVVMGITAKPYFSPAGTVTMLDIGQGDAFVIELPYRRGVVMIDAGARFTFDDMEATDSVYKQILKPFFYSRGIHELDALVLTHEDLDHIGSASYIIQNMEVEKVIVSDYFDYQELQKSMESKFTPEIVQVKRNDSIIVGDQKFYVIGPAVDYGSSNENSLVLFAYIGGKNWLFTGDIGKSEEKELIEAYPNLDIDILKVAHHGSNTSTNSSFLETIDPSVALISVGENNSYGHPGMEVLDALKKQNSMILRTDMNGAVEFIYKDQEGTFYSHIP